LRLARKFDSKDVRLGRRHDLGWLANRLDQELADCASMRIGGTAGGGYDPTGGRLDVVSVVATRITQVADATFGVVGVGVRGAADDIETVVVAAVGREPVQTLAEQRDAGVGGQQRTSQKFVEDSAHAASLAIGGCRGYAPPL
jgi:hypothetical protein